AADKVENEGLKNYMKARAQNRYDLGHELKTIISGLDGNIYKGTSFEGDLHRLWIDFKDALTSGDKAIYAECIRGEEKFIERYKEMLSDDSLPESLRKKLNEQLSDATRAIDDLHAMKGAIEKS
ncbi:MAG: PA2169 family four-helix-bundle protein, partial [Cryomorphaceae bacterium]